MNSNTPQAMRETLYIYTDRYWSESLSYMKDVELKVVRAADYDNALAQIEALKADVLELREISCKNYNAAMEFQRELADALAQIEALKRDNALLNRQRQESNEIANGFERQRDEAREKEDWQLRVIEEKSELDTKIANLRVFIRSPKFDTVSQSEQWRMTTQMHTMVQYSAILGARIGEWQ